MINTFIMKKYAALFTCGLLPTIFFFIGLTMYGFLMSLAFLGGGLIIAIPLCNLILRNPFTQMLEGAGILALNFDSTGVIRPFIVSVNSPYIKGKMGKSNVNDVFDRAAVFNLAAPKKAEKPLETTEEEVIIRLGEKEYNQARFALFHYPVLIWNDQIKSILTKDFLSDEEKTAFTEHGILYLNRKVEELTSMVRDFGRYIVELTKPEDKWYQNKWIWFVIIAAGIILVALFAGPVFETITGGIKTAGEGLKGAGGVITPR